MGFPTSRLILRLETTTIRHEREWGGEVMLTGGDWEGGGLADHRGLHPGRRCGGDGGARLWVAFWGGFLVMLNFFPEIQPKLS